MAAKSDTPLLGAYLVVGTDELKRETVLKRLRDRVAKEGDLSFNSEQFNGEVASAEQIVAACNTLPFASNVRMVVVLAADKLAKAEAEQLVAYLESPCKTTVLALVAAGLAKNTRLYKAVAALGKNAVIDCSPPRKSDLPNQVRAMSLTHGVAITPAAAHALIDLVGENTVALNAELAKLALAHTGNDPISDGEVMALVARVAEAKPWEFVDAFSSRNVAKCILVEQRIESVGPISLLARCVMRIRELLCAKSLAQRGQPPSAMAAYLGVPDWRVKNHGQWARNFTREELIRALGTAVAAERAMKSGSDPQATFRQWYLNVLG